MKALISTLLALLVATSITAPTGAQIVDKKSLNLDGAKKAIAAAVEYAKHNIRCNTLSPGFVVNVRRDKDMTPERRKQVEAMHLTRLGNARDAAFAAVYLASRESEFLTGINLQLDGGSSIARAASLG